jgi:hypothetical protein
MPFFGNLLTKKSIRRFERVIGNQMKKTNRIAALLVLVCVLVFFFSSAAFSQSPLSGGGTGSSVDAAEARSAGAGSETASAEVGGKQRLL